MIMSTVEQGKPDKSHYNTNFGGFVRVYEYDDEIEMTFAFKKFK